MHPGRARVLIVIWLLAGAVALPGVAAAPSPLPPTLVVHSPILIASNADFTAANGVKAGTGTPGDPYVISGWHVKASTGAAITVRDVSAAFVVRDNLVEATGTAAGIVVERASGSATVANNQVHVQGGTGIRLAATAALARDNTVQGTGATTGAGIVSVNHHGAVVENTVATVGVAIQASGGAPAITGNNVGITGSGIVVSDSAVGTSVTGNVVANVAGTGIRVTRATHTLVESNLVEHVQVGVDVSSCVEVTLSLNDVHATTQVAARIASCNLTVSANLFADGLLGVDVKDSDVRFLDNTVYNHLDVGVTFRNTEGRAAGNLVQLNGGGIRLTDALVVKLHGNTLENNAWGLDIPYASRQSIPHMHGNFVNGINVDGGVNPAEKSWFYKAANVQVNGVTLDSGFSAGYFGAMSVQGGLVLYEVDTALVTNVEVSHQSTGVLAVNAFNVQVEESLLLSNTIGVHLKPLDVAFQVPPCAGFVKNTTIEIPIDPPKTIGVKVEDCFAGVFNNTIRLVDVGVTFNAGASGSIVGNDVSFTTDVGIEVTGEDDEEHDVVIVADNRVHAGRTGARLHASGSTWLNNTIVGNTRTGIELHGGAHPVLRGNNVSLNAHGVVDLQSCDLGSESCATPEEVDGNTFYANAGVGLTLKGGTVITDNRFVANGELGVEAYGEVHFQGNLVTHTERGDGARFEGGITIWDSTFHGNAKNGLFLRGDAHLRDSSFTANMVAGIEIYARMVVALRLNVSGNFDGIVIQENPEIPEITPPDTEVTITPPPLYIEPGRIVPPWEPVQPGDVTGIVDAIYYPDPLFLHRSVIENNERNAIRAGAAVVNASYNYWGEGTDLFGPGRDTGVTGQFGNTISPHVYAFPWYASRSMTTTGPVPGL